MSGPQTTLASPGSTITFGDDVDHFENGVLRLLNLDRAAFERWIDLAEQSRAGGLLDKLAQGFLALRSPPNPPTMHREPVDPGPAGEPSVLWHASITENPTFGMARSGDGSLAFLVEWRGSRWCRVSTPPAYEREYFEGEKAVAGGYGRYEEQQGWRLEKGARQVRELEEHGAFFPGARVLDVGSGYGYFRRAVEEASGIHEGLEISAHARATAHRLFGFETLNLTLEEQAFREEGSFDLVTLWDVIEHLPDATALLTTVARCLKPNGIVALKTPNLDCPEATVFGPHYHSLKREHLVMFSIASLCRYAAPAGLVPIHKHSVSHLLRGFVGAQQTQAYERALHGSDLVAYFQKVPLTPPPRTSS